MSRVVVVGGATATGKSAIAVQVALHYGCPILSADSRQFYRQMSIGTAVPSSEQLSAVTHYFVQDRSVEEPLSAGEYEKEAIGRLSMIFASGCDMAVVVGGSGLYIDALLYGFDPLPSSEQVRLELNSLYRREGLQPLLDGLQMADPAYFNIVDRSNPIRVIRALEVCRTSGMPYSNLRSGRRCERDFSITKLALDLPREELYLRIDDRVDQMMVLGLEQEVRSVEQYRDLTPLKTVGYSELFDYFDSRVTLSRAVELIKQHTRNYAKRQSTWLRRDRDLHSFNPSDMEGIINYIDGDN